MTSLFRTEYCDITRADLLSKGRQLYKDVVVPDSQESLEKLESMTVEQRNTPTWDAYPAGRMTASNAHAVWTLRESTDATNLVSWLLGYGGHVTSKYTQHGIRSEGEAMKAYTERMKQIHHHCEVRRRGLVVFPDLPFLGASPDGQRICSCHSNILVELKCPYTLMNLDPRSHFGAKNFCIDVDGKVKKNHAHFTQVQMQMHVTKLHQCDLVICTGDPLLMYIVIVNYDEEFCKELVCKCTLLFINQIMPELMTREIESKVDKPQQHRDSICFSAKPA